MKNFNVATAREFFGDLCNCHHSVNPIPKAQEEVAELLPGLFDGKRFYKMHPRPNNHPRSREYAYYRYCIDAVKVDGLWLEFGVFKGASSKFINKIKSELHPKSQKRLHGFDSFEGLPEEWTGNGSPKGTFKTKPPVVPGVTFHKGWFSDTIPQFLKSNKDKCAFIHIDCDIYSSTVDILENLSSRIVPGTVILFDEFTGYDAWKDHEYKAFIEFVKKYNVEYKWLACVVNAGQAACKITKIKYHTNKNEKV
tara:strand:- start:48 stop:803 length:756 start_codon:yes stop_codon:yes gene_type:complete